jgi:hypothetical protein
MVSSVLPTNSATGMEPLRNIEVIQPPNVSMDPVQKYLISIMTMCNTMFDQLTAAGEDALLIPPLHVHPQKTKFLISFYP